MPLQIRFLERGRVTICTFRSFCFHSKPQYSSFLVYSMGPYGLLTLHSDTIRRGRSNSMSSFNYRHSNVNTSFCIGASVLHNLTCGRASAESYLIFDRISYRKDALHLSPSPALLSKALNNEVQAENRNVAV